MADIDVATMTGADLTSFREAMLRAGMECLLGKATGVDANATGDTAIPISAGQDYYITRIIFANYSAVPLSYNGRVRTASSGGGAVLSGASGPPFVDAPAQAADQGAFSAAGYSPKLNQSTLYWNGEDAEGSALTFDLLIYGIYADPA